MFLPKNFLPKNLYNFKFLNAEINYIDNLKTVKITLKFKLDLRKASCQIRTNHDHDNICQFHRTQNRILKRVKINKGHARLKNISEILVL